MPYLEQNLLFQRDFSNLNDRFKDLTIPAALNFKNILSGGTKYIKSNFSHTNLISDDSFNNLLKNVNPHSSLSLENKSKKGKKTKNFKIKSKTTRKKVE
jgi:hypothetical protein